MESIDRLVRNLALFLVAVGLLAAGCTPSTSQVVDMRTAPASWAAGDFKTLLACIRGVDAPADPDKHRRKALWRIEALRTLHAIDRRLDYPATQPERHRDLLAVTLEEYQAPGAAEGKDRVQAWAVHLLAEATPSRPAADFVTVLNETSTPSDPQGRVRLAALSALAGRLDDVATDPALRQRVLYDLAGITADLQAGRITGDRRDDLATLAYGLRSRLTNYPAVVELLSTAMARDDTPALLEVLTWNYQQLKVRAHREGPEASKAFGANVASLLDLAWQEDKAVRERSRLILAEFAPTNLHAAILARLVADAPALPEDYPQLIVLTLAIDRVLRPPADWRERRQHAFAAVLADLGGLDIEQRELIFAKMLAGDPTQLAAWLAGLTPEAVGADEVPADQYLRYARRVYASVDPNAAAGLAQPVAAFMQNPALPIRQQVAAILAERQPVLLAAAAGRAMQADAPHVDPAADYAVDVYIDTLTTLEAADKLPALRDALKPDDPYALLGRGLARPTWATRTRVAEFLDSRDPALLVRMLVENINAQADRGEDVDARQWCLLGDLAQTHTKTLPRGVADGAMRALARGLASKDEEVALLCSRYLLELGADPAGMTGNAATRAMIDLATPANGRAKP